MQQTVNDIIFNTQHIITRPFELKGLSNPWCSMHQLWSGPNAISLAMPWLGILL